ncbi:phosphoprotein [Paraavulavirus wisconsinense]|uniref:Phosphoprotein n=1 Tax=Paraavulavirus wisconsinense TaxID=3052594 RepID=D5FGX3_9MONO|nr:phosphoprotein [Paraavulavirus wisconsinense]ACI47549.1 phosphoprotein [Paraavulavirus wisconsinense]
MDLEFSSEEAVAALLDVSSSTITEFLSKQSIPDPGFLNSPSQSSSPSPEPSTSTTGDFLSQLSGDIPDTTTSGVEPSAPLDTGDTSLVQHIEEGLPSDFYIPKVNNYHSNLFKGGSSLLATAESPGLTVTHKDTTTPESTPVMAKKKKKQKHCKVPASSAYQHIDNLGTGESTPLHGMQDQEPSKPKHGVTPHVPQSQPSQSSIDVLADNVPNSVTSVSIPLTMVESLISQVSKLSDQVSQIQKLVSTLPQIKTDIASIRNMQAALEGQISMIRILDPGNNTESSLNTLRNSGNRAPVVICGPGDPHRSLIKSENPTICLDELARPTQANSPPKSQDNQRDLSAQRHAITALLETRVAPGPKRDRLMEMVVAAKSASDLIKVKRMAILGQ